MMINDLLSMLMDVPPKLAGAWAAWFVIGLLLSIWGRREKGRLIFNDSQPKHKSGVRAAAVSLPPTGVRAPVTPSKSVPLTSGDAFGELEQLLEAESSSHRTPGEKPAQLLAEQPVLAAPQSLP